MKTKKSGSGTVLTGYTGTATNAGYTARYIFNFSTLNQTPQEAALYMTACSIVRRCITRRRTE